MSTAIQTSNLKVEKSTVYGEAQIDPIVKKTCLFPLLTSYDKQFLTSKIIWIQDVNRQIFSEEQISTSKKITQIAFAFLISGFFGVVAALCWPISLVLAVLSLSVATGYFAKASYLSLNPPLLRLRLDHSLENLKDLAKSNPNKKAFIQEFLTEKIEELENILKQDFRSFPPQLSRWPYEDLLKAVRNVEVTRSEITLTLYQKMLKDINKLL